MKNGIIKHIFFDIGGVLLNIDPLQSLQYWSDCTGLPVDILRDGFSHEAHELYETGHLSDDEFFSAVKDGLPQPNNLNEADFWKGWDKLILDETETVKLLTLLKNSYHVYLLSNTNPRHIKHELNKRFSFQKNVHRTFYSFEMNCRKPNKEIYLKALKNIGATPNESIFIDDMLVNIKQAKKLGFNTIHYTGYENMIKMLNEIGIITQ
ncbi:MAG: HAD family hydrolase [Fidelibacterota bacterium]